MTDQRAGDEDFAWSPFADMVVRDVDRRIHFYERGAQEHAVRETLVYLRSLPVEQRMEAMGMRPVDPFSRDERQHGSGCMYPRGAPCDCTASSGPMWKEAR